MPIVINDNTTGSESAWIDWTMPTFGQQNVSRSVEFTIKFSRILAVASFIPEHFHLFGMTDGEELPGIFATINPAHDYDDAAKVLKVHLTRALDPNEQYLFVIDGLYDAASLPQDSMHSVVFTTNALDISLDPVQSQGPIVVVDHTIVTADLDTTTSAIDPNAHYAYMEPTDRSYNVDKNMNELMVSFSPNDITGAVVTVKRRLVSWQETSWSTITSITAETQPEGSIYPDPFIEDGMITIPLPQTAGSYVAFGYEYKVEVTNITKANATLGNAFTMEFVGQLTPMYTTVESVLEFFPGANPMQVAKLIYLYSIRAGEIQLAITFITLRSAIDYTLYSVLYYLATVNMDDIHEFTLGDLSVTNRTETMMERFEMERDKAQRGLAKVKPHFSSRGSAAPNPHAARDFDPKDTVRRIGGKIV